jgi:hypothetical protein
MRRTVNADMCRFESYRWSQFESWPLVKSESQLALNQQYGDRNLDGQPSL